MKVFCIDICSYFYSLVGTATSYGFEICECQSWWLHGIRRGFVAAHLLGLRVRILPVPVAERSKVRVCGRSFAGVSGSNHAGGLAVCVVYCKVKDNGTNLDNEDKEISTEKI